MMKLCVAFGSTNRQSISNEEKKQEKYYFIDNVLVKKKISKISIKKELIFLYMIQLEPLLK